MQKLYQFITIIILAFSLYNAKAQQAAPVNPGLVKGILKDTVHNYTVKSATVSIYRSDSTLLNYQLSNNYGEFVFKNLPPNKYYIEISHISYQLFRKGFTISSANSTVDLKSIILKPQEISLKEVKVRIPPIQMNGDTLEFNASAFKLDSNAVVEDLLRKIPNVTLWGDGQITVNGREVKSLLVNGKEFFGGDFKMATQNISKNALEKVQVYNTQQDKTNPLDSTLTVNLKLKKGKDTGHFGKIGGGYGTTERFEVDGNVNWFGPKMQLGVIAAGNNTNKIASNIRALTSNSTFKGTGINVEYQPDFRATGINRTNTGGATFSYNFIEKPTYENKKTLTANYFVQDRNNDVISNSLSAIPKGEDNRVFDRTSSNNSTASTNQNFDSKYEYSTQKHQLNIAQNFSINKGETANNSFRSSGDLFTDVISTNENIGNNRYTNNALSINADYRYNNYLNFKQKIRSFNARYNLSLNDNNSERVNKTTFIDFAKADTDRTSRRYDNNGNTLNQQLVFEIPQLKRLLFGSKRLADIELGFSNDFTMNNSATDNNISDLDSTKNIYNTNTYLTNNLHSNTFTETPAISFSKNYSKRLSNRFSRTWSFNVSAKHKLVYQNNRSEKQFQNINQSYSNFIPAAYIRYYKNQNGEYNNNFQLSFNTDISIPTIDQLAPLTDSTDRYRLQAGNPHLVEAKTRVINFYFYHYDQRGKNTLNYNANASLNFTKDAFADSIFIDKANKRTIYTANLDGYKSANIYTEIRKSLKFKRSSLQIGLNNSVSISKNPSYVDNNFNFSNNFNANNTLNFNYTFKDKIALETKEIFGFSKSKQQAFKTNYSATNTSTAFSGSYNVTKKFTLNTNISLNNNKSKGAKSIDYKIWNASAIYRFLKGNNAEFKLTALDLLHENNSFLNSINLNGGFTQANRNVLQQYFMTTLSYYPRQFGKNGVKK